VQKLGVDEALDYTQSAYLDKFVDKPFDAIVDLVGGATRLLGGALSCTQLSRLFVCVCVCMCVCVCVCVCV
jgi:hypothetical protein